MPQIPQPDSLPSNLQDTFARMQEVDPGTGTIDCTTAGPVLDWFYRERWHGEQSTGAELSWLLDWMRPCRHPARFEIGDAVCLQHLEQGQLDDCVNLAQSLLAEENDFGLQHTLALGLAAKGQTAEAATTLESALNGADGQAMPAEVRSQALLDLAQLHQQQGALFKALRPAEEALNIASSNDDEATLNEAARFLVTQLVAQGGADEAWRTLAPLLTPNRVELWQLAFEHLESQMGADERDRGAEALVASGNTDLVVKLLSDRANRSQDRSELTLAYAAALALNAPVDIVAPLASVLLLRDEDRKDELAPLIAASAIAVAESEEQRSVKQAQWHRSSVVLFISVAKHHGVPEAAVKQWAEDERFYREHGVIARTAEALIARLDHPPGWLIEATREIQ